MPSQYQPQTDVLIAFGANLGDCEAALKQTIKLLESSEDILSLECSKAIKTKAVTGTESSSQSEYLNAAIRLRATCSAAELHKCLVDVEKQLGREREERWGPRTVDLDLLLFGDTQLTSEALTIPHPRMSFRRFVLEPAIDVAADMVHPSSGMTVEQLLNHIDNTELKIVVVTDDLEYASSITSDLSQYVDIVRETSEFLAVASGARLVVSAFTESEIDPETNLLMRFATNFAGPTLQLSRTPGTNIAAKEIHAAIEAMQ